jgi:hypothetical protein
LTDREPRHDEQSEYRELADVEGTLQPLNQRRADKAPTTPIVALASEPGCIRG